MDLSRLPSVTFNDVLNDTQFCYHLVYPKFFNLAKKQNRTQSSTSTGNTLKNEKKRRRRGRPRKEETNQRSEEARRIAVENVAADDKSDAKLVQLACSRTRSGRVSRPPKHMSKFIETRISSISDINPIAMDTSKSLLSNNGAEHSADVVETMKTAPEPKRVRKNMDRFTCTTCKKVYLGRKKLLKHYQAFPEHKVPANRPFISSQFQTNGGCINGSGGPNSFLFDELMKLIDRTAQTERISIFLAEISNFVSKVDALKSKIVHSNLNSHTTSTSEYYLDKNVSKILGLEKEGLHQLNDRAFDDKFQTTFSTYIDDRPPSVNISSPLSNLPLQSLGYNLDHFPLVNYDQISDNAVCELGKSNGNDGIGDLQNPILDISLDLFSFNGIK